MNCKLGDIAIVLSDPFPENVGRIVEIIGAGAPYGDGLIYWRCAVMGGCPMSCRMFNDNVPTGITALADDWVDIADACLKPIRAPDQSMTAKRAEAVTA